MSSRGRYRKGGKNKDGNNQETQELLEEILKTVRKERDKKAKGIKKRQRGSWRVIGGEKTKE